MCRELGALKQSIESYAASFDPRTLTHAQAAEVVRLCTAIESRIESMRGLAAAVQAEGTSYQAEGYRSPEERLARTAGMSPSKAKRMLRTGRRMLEQPKVQHAALTGELSPEQAEAVAAGAEANPSKTEELLDLAKGSSLPELHDAVARAKADGIDLEQRRRNIHSHREFHAYTDLEGVRQTRMSGNPEDGIVMDRVLTEIGRKLTTNRRALQIPNETMAALDYDAMVALFSIASGKDGEDITLADLIEIGLFPQWDVTAGPDASPSPSSPPDIPGGPVPCPPASLFDAVGEDAPPVEPSPAPTADKPAARKWLAGRPVEVLVHIELDTLLRGYPLEGETCEIPGYGPVPVSLVRELVESGQAKLAFVLTKQKVISGVYLDRRHPSTYQKAALDWTYPTCAVKGCNTRRGLQADHRDDWAKTHYTVIDLLDYLCYFHHSKKTRDGWALVPGTGKRDFVPPDDPRHPRHSRRQADGAAGPSPPDAA